MDYRELGRTGVRISRLCLGTMTFGEQNSEAEGHAQMDHAFDRGIKSSMPPRYRSACPDTEGAHRGDHRHRLAARKARDKVAIATKVAAAAR
jgi:aryl-alcohol dehydrogenase-like predicted oxidoreductase